MTSPPAIYGQFGTALALAEQSLTERLHEHLAQRDIRPETWYALQLIATRGPGLARETLNHDLQRSRNVDTDTTSDLLARLEIDGLIRGDAELDLTDEGKAFHRSLREYIAGPTAQLLGQFDIHDIETTVRTLQAITERAAGDPSRASRVAHPPAV
jgi:DNA-binding MarR family transcriptional regulator